MLQVSAEALALAEPSLQAEDGWRARTGVYVGCMFNDYMTVLQQSHGYGPTGPLLTGKEDRLMLAAGIHEQQMKGLSRSEGWCCWS